MKIKGIFCESGLFARIILLLGIVSVSLLILGVSFSLLYALLSGDNTQTLMADPAFMKGSQLVQSIAIFVLPALLMAFLISRHPWKYLEVERLADFKTLFLTVVSMFVMIPFMNLIIQWNEQITFPSWLQSLETVFREKEELMADTTKLLLQTDSAAGWIFNLFLVGVVAAVSEELFFRGILQNLFRDKWKNPHLAIWLAAFIFSAIHLQFYGFFARLLLGAYFGYLLVWTRSLWIPILAHFLNNALALGQFYMESQGNDPQSWSDDLAPSMLYGSAIGALILFGFIVALLKRNKNH